MQLTKVQRRFVLHWGEMGTRWGVNRTVAQIHALLFVSPQPLNAEQIAATLSVARSNVSTSLRELQGWGIITVVNKLGDRRDYYEALQDVWRIYTIVMDERKRRELDPTARVLAECVEQAKADGNDPYTAQRLADMLSFMQTMTTWYEQMRKLPPSAFKRMATMGSRLAGLFTRTGKGK